MGGKIAAAKSYVFSTHLAKRQWLAKHIWPTVKANISTVLHTRDLGSHPSLSRRSVGATLSKRMITAAVTARRFRYLPTTYAAKTKLIRAKILSMGLYGCEATYCAEAAVNALRTAIADLIAPWSSLRAPVLVFEASSHGEDVDPSVQVFV